MCAVLSSVWVNLNKLLKISKIQFKFEAQKIFEHHIIHLYLPLHLPQAKKKLNNKMMKQKICFLCVGISITILLINEISIPRPNDIFFHVMV